MPEDFGLLGMAMVFASLTDSFVDFGFGNAVIQKQRVNRVQLSTVFWINMLMALVLGILMYVSAPLIASYFEMPKLEPITRLMSLTFLIKGLTTLQNALFRKKLDYKTPFKIEVAAGIFSGALGIYLAYTGFGVYSLIFSQISGWIVGTLLIWYFSTWKPAFLFDINQIKELWSFGYKYSLSIFIDSMFSRMDTLVIGKIFSASILGLFYKAKSLNKLVVQYAFSSFSGVLFPSLSKLGGDTEKLKNTLKKILHIVCFTTFLFSGLMFINAKAVIILLFTEKWVGSVSLFKILGLFSFIYTIPTVLVSPINAIGKSGANLRIEIAKKALYLFAIPIAIYSGLNGYIFATCIAALIGMHLNAYAVQKYLNLSIINQQKIVFRYMLPFIFLIAIDAIVDFNLANNILSILSKTVVYVILYFLYHYIFKSSGLQEVDQILITPNYHRLKKILG